MLKAVVEVFWIQIAAVVVEVCVHALQPGAAPTSAPRVAVLMKEEFRVSRKRFTVNGDSGRGLGCTVQSLR